MKLLLDTHIALWAIADDKKLPESAVDWLENPENIIYYSMVSVWEIALKHAINAKNMPIEEERFVEFCEKTGFMCLPIEQAHIYAVKTLSRKKGKPKHNDPFDRLLIAQAKTEELDFVTHDALLSNYAEPCICYV